MNHFEVEFSTGRSLRDQIRLSLQTAIVSGELRPGEQLSVPALADRFGVSKTPVREAVLDLERRGFVETIKNTGIRIAEPQFERVREITDIRLLLEPPLMRPLVGRLSLNHLNELREIARSEIQHTRTSSFRQRAEAELEFHQSLISGMGNKTLTELIMELRYQSGISGLYQKLTLEQLEESAAEHLQLVDFLEERRGSDAEKLMRNHIDRVIEWFTAHI